jgi:hypothetical protein
VYSRQIDGRDITLEPSGWTYDNTGSLWYPNAEGLMSIQGIYFKRQLSKMDFEDTQWKQWVKRHPHSKIMK